MSCRFWSRYGSIRELHPRHVVLTTGGTETPNVPAIPGLTDEFSGEIVHSSRFTSGANYTGKNVLVVGMGTSGHDVALDVAKHGGTAKMLQRSPVIVLDLETANLSYADYSARVIPAEVLDTRFLASLVYPQLVQNLEALTAVGMERDRELHDKLRKAGVKVWSGEADRGFIYNYFQTGGGYYLDVGACQRIIDGEIEVLQFDDVERFTATGLRRDDGRELKFDTVVLATGYAPIEQALERYFGTEVATKVGKVWGFGPDGEMRNTWKPTPQEGLWITLGAVISARMYSPLTAALIKGELERLVPPEFKHPDHSSRVPRTQVVEL